MNDPKALIIGLNLDDLAKTVPLCEAKAVTLGGEGIEAAEWQRKGIIHANGWLLEKDAVKRGRLVKRFPYKSHNELRTFPQVLEGLYGTERASVDYGHVDLCGTLTDEAIADFVPVLPLVLKSKGKRLAVTVADSRRNRALETWPSVLDRGYELFGAKADETYAKILAVQREIPINEAMPDTFVKFIPENGAKREFAFLVEFAEILRNLGFSWVPVSMERYVYVSRYSGRAFRMRTYFFRFAPKKLAKPARAIARVWVKSRLSFANNEGLQEIHQAVERKRSQPKAKQQQKGKKMPAKQGEAKPSKLAIIARTIGGDVEVEYNQLLAKAGAANKILKAFSAAGIDIVGSSSVPVQTADEKPRRGRPPSTGNRKTIDDLDVRELIVLRIEALELRASVNGEWIPQKKKFLQAKFGYCTANLSRRLGGLIARTSGDYREGFRRDVVEAFGEEGAKPYLERLDKLPLKYHHE